MWFWFAFSNNQWWWAFLHVCWLHKCLLLRSVCSYPLSTFWWGCLFLLLLYFKSWDSCAERAGFLHKYACAMVICCTHRPSSTLGIFPNAIPPLARHPLTNAGVWHSPPYAHVFSLFNSHLWVRTCSVWFPVPVSVCWEWWFPSSSMSLQRTPTYHFWWLHSIPWCICATFSLSSLSLMGIWVASKSLLLWTGLQ